MSTPSLEFAFRGESRDFSLLLKRNCSIAPGALACVFAALAVAVLGIGIGFAIAGAWLILPFAGLEVLLLGTVFLLYARRTGDCETIELAHGRLTIEVTGPPAKVDALQNLLSPYGIKELVRTGKIVLTRGARSTAEMRGSQ